MPNKHFPKVGAFDLNKWYDEEVRRLEKLNREGFTDSTPKDSEVAYKVTMNWPEDLIGAEVFPKEKLGPKLQMLDPIRMEHEVYIWPAGTQEFIIGGQDIENVHRAKERCRNLIDKICIETFKAPNDACFILDRDRGDVVVLEKAEGWWPYRYFLWITPRLLPDPSQDVRSRSQNDNYLHPTQLSFIQTVLINALDKVGYEQGNYDLSIYLGCVALLRPDKTMVGMMHSKNKFKEAIAERHLACQTNKWLFDDDDGKKLLSRMMAADHLFEPSAPIMFFGDSPQTLQETWPFFRGTWVFQDPNLPSGQQSRSGTQGNQASSNFVVQIDWHKNGDDMYDKDPPRYYRLLPGASAPKTNIDIKLLELGESKAWEFSLSSMASVPKSSAPKRLQDFVEGVQMKLDYNLQSQEPFVVGNLSRMRLVMSRLDKIYTFGIKDTGYKVEVMGMWYPNEKIPCWGLSIRHVDWASRLVELERNKVGKRPEWEDIIAKAFLPGGIEVLDRVMKDVSAIVM